MTKCITLPGLFAGKMHALLFRSWGNRVKGCDWYDFEWYVRNSIPLDFAHLQQRTRDFNGIELDRDKFKQLLNERMRSTDIDAIKKGRAPLRKKSLRARHLEHRLLHATRHPHPHLLTHLRVG